MARQESEREDLLHEATALVERMEFRLADYGEPLVFGFRRGGSASFYVGGEPVFQFNTRGELRRVYWQGRPVKAEQGRLVALSRQRTANSIRTHSATTIAGRIGRLLADCQTWLKRIAQAIAANGIQVVGQAPADDSLLSRIESWLRAMPAKLAIAERSNVE